MAENLYMDLVSQLEDSIAKMNVGEKLTSERLLSEKYGVSRHVVREALRVLEEKGMVDIRQGRGAFVTDHKEDKLAEQLQMMIGSGKHTLQDIMEVRQSLELAVFEKAAERADISDILALEKIYNKMEANRKNPQAYINADMEFHKQLAAATHNPLYQVLISTFLAVGGGEYFSLTKIFPEALEDAQVEHYKMIEALKTRNVKLILEAGREHFDIQKYVE